MADALRIRRPVETSPLWKWLAIILIAIPLVALRLLWRRGVVIHHPNPTINFALHAMLILWPVLLAVWYFRDQPIYYADDETELGETSLPKTVRESWWQPAFLFAPLIAIIVAAGIEAVRWASQGIPDWTTSLYSALGIILVTVLFLLPYGTMLREKTQVRVSDAGMRIGNLHFYEWSNISRIVKKGNVWGLYHRAQPRLPAGNFYLANKEGQETLMRYLAARNIPVENRDDPFVGRVKFGVGLGTLALVAITVLVYFLTNLDLRWILIGSAVAGVVATAMVEQVRAVSQFTKQQPVWDKE